VSGSSTREGCDRFLDFIERELLPAVDGRFRTAAPRVLVGHSSGGILATYAAATRRTFRGVVALDTPIELGDLWLAERLLGRAKSDTTPLRYAAIGARFSWPSRSWTALTAAAPRTWALHYEHLEHENHTSMPFLGMYLGLRELFADYSVIAAPKSPTTSILPYYTKLSASLGAPVSPPRTLLRDVIDDLLAEGRGRAAHDAYETLAGAYGEPRDATQLKAEIADVERRPPPTETVESLLAKPFPSADAMRPYVGEWAGDTWMNADEPRTGRQQLRIRIVDGRVEGETIHHPTRPTRSCRSGPISSSHRRASPSVT
jgi:pimeloyl-ACP methyl ester carboxylesterase